MPRRGKVHVKIWHDVHQFAGAHFELKPNPTCNDKV